MLVSFPVVSRVRVADSIADTWIDAVPTVPYFDQRPTLLNPSGSERKVGNAESVDVKCCVHGRSRER